MARISLERLAHAYRPGGPYAVQPMDLVWAQGGAYALLGPSGCGKTTLLNIISGLIHPSEGRVRFDDQDVTELPTEARNIAQVFQFPVVYDTMTVRQNFAFPLKNRGVQAPEIARRVAEIAALLDMAEVLDRPARNLTADAKQKISLGRGLVRSDVAAILFDEPLTVIDPHLKWQLRRKLKQIHHELKLTLIYVTHDQVEALTFAEEVVVMTRGRAVQIGSADELFERPQHTFVGHFIGSPGMNFLPAGMVPGAPEGATLLGVRPEYVTITAPNTAGAVTAIVTQRQDVGTYWLVTAKTGSSVIRARLSADASPPAVGDTAWFTVVGTHTCYYKNEELVA